MSSSTKQVFGIEGTVGRKIVSLSKMSPPPVASHSSIRSEGSTSAFCRSHSRSFCLRNCAERVEHPRYAVGILKENKHLHFVYCTLVSVNWRKSAREKSLDFSGGQNGKSTVVNSHRQQGGTDGKLLP